MDIENDADISKADALVQLQKAVDNRAEEAELRQAFDAVLDQTNPGWREDAGWEERIQSVGLLIAAKGVLRRHLT